MSIITELIKSIVSTWGDGDIDYPLYFNHAPQGTAYPLVVFNVVDSPRNFAMKTGNGNIHTYSNIRVQFTVFANENQMSEAMLASSAIEDLYKFQNKELANGVTQIWAQPANTRIQFYDMGEKVWQVITDMIFKVGN